MKIVKPFFSQGFTSSEALTRSQQVEGDDWRGKVSLQVKL